MCLGYARQPYLGKARQPYLGKARQPYLNDKRLFNGMLRERMGIFIHLPNKFTGHWQTIFRIVCCIST